MLTQTELRATLQQVLERADALGATVELFDGLPAWQARYERLPPVAVVVPVYDDAEQIRCCLQSLARTVGQEVQVLLFDDHGPDPAVSEVCADFVARRPGTRYARNPRNLGWVETCNLGMRAADRGRDIVLLNADTQLSAGWLRRLRRAAASRSNVGTVSPLSNAAGVYSLPTPHRDAPLPPGIPVDDCAALLDLVSPRLYEEVPSTSGFCLYLRRSAIDAVGVFDDRLFCRGYAEENDFCCRAQASGFINVCDDTTFVAHVRGASFGSEKRILKVRNGRVLRALHPGHVDSLVAWETSTALASVRRNYSALWSAFLEADPAARAWLTHSGPVQLGEHGDWGAAGRSIGLSNGRVDVFGLLEGPAPVDAGERLRVRWGIWGPGTGCG